MFLSEIPELDATPKVIEGLVSISDLGEEKARVRRDCVDLGSGSPRSG